MTSIAWSCFWESLGCRFESGSGFEPRAAHQLSRPSCGWPNIHVPRSTALHRNPLRWQVENLDHLSGAPSKLRLALTPTPKIMLSPCRETSVMRDDHCQTLSTVCAGRRWCARFMPRPVTFDGLKGCVLMSLASTWAVTLHQMDGVVVERGPGLPDVQAFPKAPIMIIVSESSAKATLLGRTDRYTPARHRSSAPRDDALKYADARPISVHTEEISSDQWVSNLRLVTNHRDHLSVLRR